MSTYQSLFTLYNFKVKSVDYSVSKQGTPYAIIFLENVQKGEYITVLDFDLITVLNKKISSLLVGKSYDITLEYRVDYNYILLRWWSNSKEERMSNGSESYNSRF